MVVGSKGGLDEHEGTGGHENDDALSGNDIRNL